MDAAGVIDALKHVVDSPPRSASEAGLLEDALLSITPRLPQLEDFLVALASYEPAENPSAHMHGFENLRSEARAALHDLDHHERCVHDVPLTQPP